MTEALWFVLASVLLAGLIPMFKWSVKAIAHEIVRVVATELDLPQLSTDIAYLKDELTINGGETVKDRVALLQNQMSEVQRDLEILLGN